MMATWHSAKTADWLYSFGLEVAKTGNVRQAMHDDDVALPLDEYSTLLIDAGLPGHSIIMDKALALIDSAREYIVMSCQYYPNDKTARHLKRAHERGVRVRIVYNHPSAHPFPHNLLHGAVVRNERKRLPPQLFRDELPKGHPYIHAKLLATDAGVLVGSHNYVLAGVHFGTAEIALLRRDPQFAREAITKLAGQIRRPKV
jgi:phosphatidylserine/phosphatidylglycerophosphate/cardiolipin synthase-like enzyme